MNRISDEELLAIWKRWSRETEFFAIGKVAQAQLEADIKSAKADGEHAYETGKQVQFNADKKVMREQMAMQEGYMELAKQAVVGEIFKEIEGGNFGIPKALTAKSQQDYQALKERYLKEQSKWYGNGQYGKS